MLWKTSKKKTVSEKLNSLAAEGRASREAMTV
jgi:hypothetical protein